MKKLKITRYSDGGHSWFKVPKKLLKELGIAEKISRYSYMLGEFAYLEEDCDAGIFFQAYTKASNLTWQVIEASFEVEEKHSNKQSKVRSYASYKPNYERPEWSIGKKVTLYGKEYTMNEINGVKTIFNGVQNFKVSNTQLDELFEVK